MTTRRIKPGTLTGFERAWRPDRHPEGMQRAYAYWSEDDAELQLLADFLRRTAHAGRTATDELARPSD